MKNSNAVLEDLQKLYELKDLSQPKVRMQNQVNSKCGSLSFFIIPSLMDGGTGYSV